MENCTVWLKRYLNCGMSECGAVRSDALAAGYTKAELKAARKELGVKTWHQIDTLEEPRIDNWFWYLPEESICGNGK